MVQLHPRSNTQLLPSSHMLLSLSFPAPILTCALALLSLSFPVSILPQIIGVEPSGANAMTISLQRGERVALSRVDAFADGVAVKQVRVGVYGQGLVTGAW